ncbi:MAG: tetratricopeptide repeat protein [Elusimicrobiota bacterium]
MTALLLVAVGLSVSAYGQDLRALYLRGQARHKASDVKGALELWETGLQKAKDKQDLQAMGFFLGAIGVAYQDMGDYPRALKSHYQALENARDRGDKGTEAVALENCAAIYKRQSDFPKMLESRKQAAQIYHELGKKKKEANSLRAAGYAQKRLGDYPAALGLYRQALEIHRGQGDKKGEAAALTDLGNVHNDRSEFDQALKYHRQALESHRALGDKEGEGVALNNIGLVRQRMGDNQQALENGKQALEIAQKTKDKEAEGVSLDNLGLVYRQLGQYRKAFDHHMRAMWIARDLGDKHGQGIALMNMGNVLSAMGEYPFALEQYQKALAIHNEMNDKKGKGAVLSNIGTTYVSIGNVPKALQHLRQALEIHSDRGDKRSVAAVHINMGNVYHKIGDYPAALKQQRQALQIAREIGDKDSQAMALGNLGNILLDTGEYAQALEHYNKMIALQKESDAPTWHAELMVGDVHFARGELEEAFAIYSRAQSPLRLGRYYLAKEDFAQAKKSFMETLATTETRRRSVELFANYTGLGLAFEGLDDRASAFKYFLKASELIERMRSTLTGPQRAGFFGASDLGFRRLEAYEGLVRTAPRTSAENRGAFYYAEFTRGRLLAESISSRHGEAAPSIPPAVGKREVELENKLAFVYTQMDAAYEKKETDRYQELERELQGLMRSRAKLIEQLRADHPEYAAVKYPEPVAIADVALAADETLAEFEVTETETLLFILSGKDKSLQVRRIKVSRRQLAQAVDQYRQAFVEAGSAMDLAKYDAAAGKKLHDLLFADELQKLPAGARLIIVPDEALSVLPFESLPISLPKVEKIGEGKHGPFPIGVKYLGDRFAVSYAQSATSLSLLRTLNKGWAQSHAALAVVDPVFSPADSRAAALAQRTPSAVAKQQLNAIAQWKKMGVGGTRRRGAQRAAAPGDAVDAMFPRLEKTAEIGRRLKELFGDEAAVIAGEEAREDAVLKMPLESYRYIVFGTHGILDGAVPYVRQPALVLNQVGNAEGVDGFLTMGSVMGLKMRAELTALTACDTGMGKNVSGEGVMGMGRAFQYAGAANVLISLWSVSEDATVALAGEFFARLKDGKEPAEALRLARSAIRRDGYEHPFYWSAFVLMGR